MNGCMYGRAVLRERNEKKKDEKGPSPYMRAQLLDETWDERTRELASDKVKERKIRAITGRELEKELVCVFALPRPQMRQMCMYNCKIIASADSISLIFWH